VQVLVADAVMALILGWSAWYGALVFGLGVSIVEFNRPKFPVSGRLGGEPGAFAAGRQWRRQGGPQ
jgi:hypothetical protein